MTNALVQRLRALEGTNWSSETPSTDAEIAAAETAIGLMFPEDLRAVLRGGGGDIYGAESMLSLYPAGELFDANRNPSWPELAAMLIFGVDQGDFVYFYDPRDEMGRGAWAVFVVEKGAPVRAHARFVASDLSQLVERIIADEAVLDPEEVNEQDLDV